MLSILKLHYLSNPLKILTRHAKVHHRFGPPYKKVGDLWFRSRPLTKYTSMYSILNILYLINAKAV
jgi:hypothetical protein